jgi:hypothetical protein
LPEEAQGKKEAELLSRLHKEFFLDELADPVAQNGSFDEEPLVAIPQNLPANLESCSLDDESFNNFIQS